jgi:hypothetical protein
MCSTPAIKQKLAAKYGTDFAAASLKKRNRPMQKQEIPSQQTNKKPLRS